MQTFEKAIREKNFALTAELPLAPASTERSILADLDILGPQVDAVQVTDSPAGVPHMSPLVAASICLRHGVDAIMHLAGRDRNRIALQSDLLGAGAAGVTSLLLMRGERLPPTLTPRAQKVYEFGAKRLLRCASLIGSERGLPPANGFFLGSPVRVIDPPPAWEPRGIASKAEVGCKYVQTQPLLDPGILEIYLRRLIASRMLERVSLIACVPLVSRDADLEALRTGSRGAVLPEDFCVAIAGATSAAEARAIGIERAAAVLAELQRLPGVAGAHLAGFRDSRAAAEAISLSGTRLPGARGRPA